MTVPWYFFVRENIFCKSRLMFFIAFAVFYKFRLTYYVFNMFLPSVLFCPWSKRSTAAHACRALSGHCYAQHRPNTATPAPHRQEAGTPLGLHRPLDRNLEDTILCGEYIDFTLLLPDFLSRPQVPEIQLHLDNSTPGSGSQRQAYYSQFS